MLKRHRCYIFYIYIKIVYMVALTKLLYLVHLYSIYYIVGAILNMRKL